MQVADEVAALVKAEIEEHRMVGFTRMQKVAGFVLGLLTAAALISQILSSAGVIG